MAILMTSGIFVKMNSRTRAFIATCLVLISIKAYALSQQQITAAVKLAITDMEKLSSHLALCNVQIEKYRSSRAMQTQECLLIPPSFEAHLASHKTAMDMLTQVSLDSRVEETISRWWKTQKKLAERFKNTKILLEMDMHRHMEMIKKNHISINQKR
jgi:hypothetical protein